MIELKHQKDRAASTALAAKTSAALATYAGPVVVESFDPLLLQLLREVGCQRHLGIIVERDSDEEDGAPTPWRNLVRRHLLHWPQTRFDFISCDQRALNLPMVRLARSMRMPVTSWTIRSAEQARACRTHADQIVFEGFNPDRA